MQLSFVTLLNLNPLICKVSEQFVGTKTYTWENTENEKTNWLKHKKVYNQFWKQMKLFFKISKYFHPETPTVKGKLGHSCLTFLSVIWKVGYIPIVSIPPSSVDGEIQKMKNWLVDTQQILKTALKTNETLPQKIKILLPTDIYSEREIRPQPADLALSNVKRRIYTHSLNIHIFSWWGNLGNENLTGWHTRRFTTSFKNKWNFSTKDQNTFTHRHLQWKGK